MAAGLVQQEVIGVPEDAVGAGDFSWCEGGSDEGGSEDDHGKDGRAIPRPLAVHQVGASTLASDSGGPWDL